MRRFKHPWIFLIVLFLTNAFFSFGQGTKHQAPTLQVGLDGLSLGKGSLDAELIAEIIGQKQSEIKLKVVQSAFLSKLDNTGGTVYNYADNVIKGLLEESNEQVRTRKILESTVNLVFTYSFVNYFLMHLTNDQKTEVDALFAYYNKQGVPELDYSNGLTSRNLRGLDLAMEKDAKQQLLFNNNSNRQFSENDEFITYVAFLIDIAAEVVRDNKRLQQLGVMRTSYSNIYDYMNIYLRHKNHPLFYKNDEEAETRLTAAQKVYRSMEISLARMIEMIGAVNYAIERSTLVRMQLPEVASLFDSGGLPTLNHFYDSGLTNRLTLIKDGLEQIQNDFVKEYKERVAVVTDAELLRIVKIQFDSDFIKLQKALDDVNLVYEIAKSNTDLLKNELKNATMSDALFMIQKTTLPLLKDLARNNPESYQSIIISLDESQRLIYLHLKTTYPFLNNLTDDSDAFIDLIKSLYEFDRSSTFSDYRNLLTQLDNLSDSPANYHNVNRLHSDMVDSCF